MNRKTLFRGKRIDNGEWVEGYYCKCIEALGMKISKPAIQETDENGLFFRQVDPNTIGQFTGLCDKKGKKIFEGDIVKDDYYTCKVEWVDESCGFEPFSDSMENCHHCGGGSDPKRCEVIGNIYDNPDLLNKN